MCASGGRSAERTCRRCPGPGGRAIVVVGHHAGSVRAALLGASIPLSDVEQSRRTGTADAVLAGLRVTEDDACLIVYGDIYVSRSSLAAVCDAWKGGDVAAAALIPWLQPPRRPQDWIGAFVEDKSGWCGRSAEMPRIASAVSLPATGRSFPIMRLTLKA